MHLRYTRTRTHIRNKVPRTDRERQGFVYSAVELYNGLPEDLKDLKCTKKFTKKLKELILERRGLPEVS